MTGRGLYLHIRDRDEPIRREPLDFDPAPAPGELTVEQQERLERAVDVAFCIGVAALVALAVWFAWPVSEAELYLPKG